MIATMIRIERTAKMEAAITRCKQFHPKVRRINATTVTVKGHHGTYTVRIIEPRAGLMLAECSCPAGAKGLLCYHIPAAPAATPALAPRPSMARRTGNGDNLAQVRKVVGERT